MRTFISLLLTGLCSLAVAGALMAQPPAQPTEESPAAKSKEKTEAPATGKAGRHEKKAPQETTSETGAPTEHAKGRHGANAEATTSAPPTETGAEGQHGKGRHGAKGEATTNPAAETSPGASANVTEQGGKKGKHGRNAAVTTNAETGASPGTSPAVEPGKKGHAGRGEHAGNTAASPSPSVAAAATSPATSPTTGTSPATATGTTTATGGAAGTNAALAGQGTVGKGGQKVETQQVQQIKQQHANFRAQPRPDKAPPVAFNANFRIQGADRWQGPQYEVFRAYHPERHDRNWYHSHYNRVELIGGGYYYWNNGYWYPAWGYDQSAQYYAYDGPIYVGHSAEPPDKVIADVQAELQAMGYYQGEVDGLLGPITRQALADYQADHGLMVTQAIDEPTLQALQLS